MTRFAFLRPFVMWLGSVTAFAADARQPNVVFLFSDDQRFDTIHALGNPEIHTPHLDRLVTDGFTFTHAFCMGAMQGAVCVPSRAMLLSGRSLFRVPTDLPKDVKTWPAAFADAGYSTFGIGKWHNGTASFNRSFANGKAIFFGGMTDQNKVPLQDHDPSGKYDKQRQYFGKGFSSTIFADAACDFLKGYREAKPFLLYVAFTSPHDPRTPPKEYADMYNPEKLSLPKSFLPEHPFDNGDMKLRDEQLAPWPRTEAVIRQHTADYYGMISQLDHEVGRIRATLKETGRADNTIVVFASDHGLAVGRHGLLGKQNLYDHSMRTPLIFAGPGIPKNQRSAALCYLFDVFPTLGEMANVKAPADSEGISLVPIMQGKRTGVRDVIFGSYRECQRCVRTEQWKLIHYPQINRTQLFDIKNDPDELKDLSADPRHAKELGGMRERLAVERQRFGDKTPQ